LPICSEGQSSLLWRSTLLTIISEEEPELQELITRASRPTSLGNSQGILLCKSKPQSCAKRDVCIPKGNTLCKDSTFIVVKWTFFLYNQGKLSEVKFAKCVERSKAVEGATQFRARQSVSPRAEMETSLPDGMQFSICNYPLIRASYLAGSAELSSSKEEKLKYEANKSSSAPLSEA